MLEGGSLKCPLLFKEKKLMNIFINGDTDSSYCTNVTFAFKMCKRQSNKRTKNTAKVIHYTKPQWTLTLVIHTFGCVLIHYMF